MVRIQVLELLRLMSVVAIAFRARSFSTLRFHSLNASVFVALSFLTSVVSNAAFAQIDDVEGVKGEALSNPPRSTSKPLKETPYAARDKIDGASLPVADLKAQANMVAPGWLRTYATAALPPDLTLAVPEYYETALEADMRMVIGDALARRGVTTVDDPNGAPFRLTYSVEVRAPQSSRPRQSRLRLESDAADRQNFGSQRLPAPGHTVRPGLSLGPRPDDEPQGPVLRASIIVLEGGERIWSGFAEAELGDYRRSELVRVLVGSLMRYWGENVELDDAHFTTGLRAGFDLGDIKGGDF